MRVLSDLMPSHARLALMAWHVDIFQKNSPSQCPSDRYRKEICKRKPDLPFAFYNPAHAGGK